MSNFDDNVAEAATCTEPPIETIRRFTVLIAARDGSHRSTIAKYLEKRGLGVIVTNCAATALSIAQSGTIDLVVTGPAMPGFNGYELTRALRDCLPEFPVILLSAGGELLEDALLDCALTMGTQAMRSADLARGYLQDAAEANPCLTLLTPRERQVMDLVTRGHGNKAVARLLSISPRTVENHRAQIMRKTNARNLAELVRVAMMQLSNSAANG